MNFYSRISYFPTDSGEIRYICPRGDSAPSEFRQIWSKERRSVLKGVNEMLPIFSAFLPIWMEFRVEDF
jgi:hypothetical protein